MSFDTKTFEHRKALLQLGGLLSDNDSKKIVYLVGLPKMLEEKTPWEVLAHLEVQGKTTVEELTRILKAIDRQDIAKKAKELIGKRRKTTDSGCKTLMLRDTLQLATKHCKILVDQIDYLKFAANKEGNKRIEEKASEAKENLINQVQKKLRYASALFSSQTEVSTSDSADSSSPISSLENSPPDRSPDSSPPSIVRSRFTASELKEVAEKLKKQKGKYFCRAP
jgi:CRISPR/Cas system CSM-associated protein Csm2 small subunit